LASVLRAPFPGATNGSGAVGMSYLRHVLQPEEKLVMVGRLSWIVYRRAILYLVLGVILVILEQIFVPQGDRRLFLIYGTAAVFALAALFAALQAWFLRFTTEIAVTNRRIIYKRGFITRHTAEMNMDKVATVDVDQSIWGRLFDYGSIRIVGTGGSTGIERLNRIAAPIALRNAIDAK
jgi:uncharacterized membrane protein YdbT with pleckstrin-like domain